MLQALRGTAAVRRLIQYTRQYTATAVVAMPLSYTGPKGPLPNDAKTGPKGEPMAPIPSASLVVLCPVGGTSSSGGSSSSSTRYATLMLQRSARDGSSFRSAIVFPGGALDLADEDAVAKMAQGDLSLCTNQATSSDADATEAAYVHSLRLCALRETFEETGLLLLPAQEGSQSNKSRAVGPAEAGIEASEWKKLRDEIHDDARAFPPFLRRVFSAVSQQDVDQESTALPPLAPMSHHSNWVTPRGVVRPAKRFDAHFFLTILDKADALGPLTSAASRSTGGDKNDTLDLSADGTETTSLTLATSEEMIESAIRDKIVLFPPQFYILADLAATLRSKHTVDMNFTPLVFRHPTETPESKADEVTPVEEEPRGLHPDSHYQFEKDSGHGPSGRLVTSVEPRAMPASGVNVDKSIMQWRGNTEEGGSGKNGEEHEEDEPFVFPLVLPGDFLASSSQRAMMRGKSPSKKTNVDLKPLNRVYVTPRSRQDGGGVIVRGARRRGLPGLIDFEEGAQLQEMGAEGELEGEDLDGEAQKAKL
jgi:nucleoside diphosphate-linked moiety X motif protein 19